MVRPLIVKSAVVCLAVAIAPWLSGGQDPLGRVLSGFALLLGVLLMWRQPAAPALKRGPLLIGYGLLMSLAALSLLWTANRYSSALWLTEWVMAALAFKLAFSISASDVGRKWLIWAYLLSAAIFSVAGVVMYLTSQYGRLTGTFYWANPAAAYLIPAIILGLEGIRRAAGKTSYGWAGFTAVFATAFLLTDSRAATAVLALIVVLYLALVKLSKRFWIHFLFSLALAYGMSFGLVKISSVTAVHSEKTAPGSRLNEAIKGESSSGSDRLYYLGSAFDMWAAHPVVGVGAGAYGDVHPTYQRRVVSASANAHNVYAQILAELGIFGALILASLLLVFFIGVVRGLAQRPELLPVALGLLGLLMHFGLDIDASYPALLLLVGSFLGIIYTQSSAKWVRPTTLAPVLAAIVLVPAVSAYLSADLANRGQFAQDDGEYAAAADYYAQSDHMLVFDPDYISAEGINLYTLASEDKAAAKANLVLALERARRAERLDPYDGQHYQLEGRILRQQNDLAGAQKAFEAALKRDHFNHPDYALDLAEVQATRGQTAAALRGIQAMLDQYPASVVANRAADDSLKFELAKLRALQRLLQAKSASTSS